MKLPHKDLFIRVILILTTVVFINNALHAQTFKVNGNAYSNSSYGANYYTLTQAAAGQNGSIWFDKKIDLTFPFTFSYSIYQGNTQAGADGMAFVLQQSGTSVVGGSGSGMGYGGILNSLDLEYDTYVNGDFQAYDPSFDHMGLMKNGEYHHFSDATKKVGTDLVKAVAFSSNVKDGKFHTSSIQWNPTTKILVAYFDGKIMLSYTGDIVKNIFNSSSAVYFGFTGSTG
ncbi:MAG: L-type lectin-domain containing protein, partial [Bacteroidota bacterium]